MEIETVYSCPFGHYCEQVQDGKINRCRFFTQIEGYDTNTGKEISKKECSITLIPMLLIENSGQQRHTSAAIESFRNEMVKANNISLNLQQKQLERK